MPEAVYLEGIPCPKCGAKLFDNRADKGSNKKPDFRCSNKDCMDGKYRTGWYVRDLEKLGKTVPPAPASSGSGGSGSGSAPRPAGPPQTVRGASELYHRAVDVMVHAWLRPDVVAKLKAAGVPLSGDALASGASGLMIYFEKHGVRVNGSEAKRETSGERAAGSQPAERSSAPPPQAARAPAPNPRSNAEGPGRPAPAPAAARSNSKPEDFSDYPEALAHEDDDLPF